MRINPVIHEHRKAAIQDVARKAGASRDAIFQELRRNEGAEGALNDAIRAIEECKGDVRKQAEADGNVALAKDNMRCFDQSMVAVSKLQKVAHINVLLLTGKLAQADEHIEHCKSLFEDEQRVLDAYDAAVKAQLLPDAAAQTADDEAGGVTPKAPPRPIAVPVGDPAPDADATAQGDEESPAQGTAGDADANKALLDDADIPPFDDDDHASPMASGD